MKHKENNNANTTQVYLLTPRSTALFEMLACSHLVNKFPLFYGTQKFITVFTSARHLSLSWARSIQSTPSHPTSWKYILVLSSHLRQGFSSGPFPSRFPNRALCTPLLSPLRATCPGHLILLDLITRTVFGEEYRSLTSSLCSCLHSPATSSLT